MTGMEISLANWNVPVITGDFARDFNSFLEALGESNQKDYEAQLYYSHIIQTESWIQARVWFVPGTDEVYEEERMIPPHLKVLVSERPRFTSQEKFIDWCKEYIPGFGRSKFWSRHSLVDKWTEVGYSLPEAVGIVLQSGIGLTVSGKLLGLLEFDLMHNIVGVNEELVKNLPEQLLPDDFDELEGQGKIEAAKEALKNFAAEKVAEAQAGSRTIGGDIDRSIYRKPIITIYPCDKPGFPYKIKITVWPEDDSGFGEGQTEEFYIRLVTEAGEIIETLPPSVEDWWHRKLGIKKKKI